MPIKMQHAVFDDSSIQYAFWYVCNMHELRWNFFFVQGVLVPGGQPNLWVSASLNHKLVPHQITAPCFSHFLAPEEEEQTLETFCPQPASNLDHQWDCSLSENNANIFTYCLSVNSCTVHVEEPNKKLITKIFLFQYNDVVLVQVRMCLSALQ